MRTLTQGQKDAITAAVVPPARIVVSFDGQNTEATNLAIDLIASLELGGATVLTQPTAISIGLMPVYGLQAASMPVDLSAAISAAFQVDNNESLAGFSQSYGADGFLYVGYEPV